MQSKSSSSISISSDYEPYKKQKTDVSDEIKRLYKLKRNEILKSLDSAKNVEQFECEHCLKKFKLN